MTRVLTCLMTFTGTLIFFSSSCFNWIHAICGFRVFEAWKWSDTASYHVTLASKGLLVSITTPDSSLYFLNFLPLIIPFLTFHNCLLIYSVPWCLFFTSSSPFPSDISIYTYCLQFGMWFLQFLDGNLVFHLSQLKMLSFVAKYKLIDFFSVWVSLYFIWTCLYKQICDSF